jgi:hypothetical protein
MTVSSFYVLLFRSANGREHDVAYHVAFDVTSQYIATIVYERQQDDGRRRDDPQKDPEVIKSFWEWSG